MIQIGECEVSLEQITDAIKNSKSYIDTLRTLNIEYNTSRANKVRDIIREYNIDNSNFTREQKAKPERVDAIREAIEKSNSIRETLIRLDLAPRGGNYKCIRKVIEDFNIDTSHFGSVPSTLPTLPIETYLKHKAPAISTSKLKNKLITEGILEKKML